MVDIHRADAESRRKAVLYIVVGSLLGAVIIALFETNQEALRSWLTSDPAQSRTRAGAVLALLTALVLGPLAAFAAWLWTFGSRVLRGERFPPGDARVIRDTPILEGLSARRRGKLFRALAVALLGAACVVSWLLWRIWATGFPEAM